MKPFAGSLRDAWRAHADDWAAWAATPDHDVFFWRYNLPAFLAILPERTDGPTLDVGCGEGRLGRVLADLGHAVVGVDAAAPLVREAAHGRPAVASAVADAAALPIGSGTIDLAVSSMVLMDVDDLHAVLGEIARVLVAGGRLCFSILHPLSTCGDFIDDDDNESAFLVSLPYSEIRRYQETMDRDGLSMTFHSEHRPIEAYVDALAGGGFVVELLREPIPTDDVLAEIPRLRRQRRIPWWLHVRARRDD
jgi:SAM-dependent methyltransferase